MNNSVKFITGQLIKRYKRFFADVKLDTGEIVTAHCPNTGSMMGLLDKGNIVFLSKTDNAKRKLKYTLEIIKVLDANIGVNTHKANRIVENAIVEKKISSLGKDYDFKREVKYGANSRIDFLITNNKKEKIYLEVKNVTLNRESDISEFPDAITSRGSKHLLNLKESIKKGYKPYVLFLTQIQSIRNFKIAKDIDPEYYNNYLLAKKSGVNFLAYKCKLNDKEIKVEEKIKIIDE